MSTAPDDVEALLAQIDADLQADGVYVHPDLAGEITDDELAQIAQNVEDVGEPVFVIVYPYEPGDAFGGNADDLMARLHDAHPADGVYLSTTEDRGADQYAGITLEGRQYGRPGGSDGELQPYELLSTVRYEQPDDLGDAFVRATELLDLPGEELLEVHEEARDDAYGSGRFGGDDGVPLGLVGGGALVALVAAVLWARRRRRRPERGPVPVLPAAAMQRIREAHDRELLDRAQAATLALGERVDATDLAARHDRGAWQSAIDHYEQARRILDHEPAPQVLDVVGALVLAERGDAALDDAVAGRPERTVRPCFLNPLHGRSTSAAPVETSVGRVTAPLCAACRKDLAAGRAPDVLDVLHRGEPTQYFATDAWPWAETGYGALEPDLVRRLQAGPRS